MMKLSFKSVFFFFYLLWVGQVHGNDNNTSDKKAQEHARTHHLALMIAHTHVPKGINTHTGKSHLIVPSWGLNYNFWLNEKWAIGLHNDMEIATYVIEEDHSSEIARERPIIVTIVGIYKPNHLLGFVGGFGREFEKNHRFWVFRFGIEFEFEIQKGWDISPSIIYDIKESTYDSWTLGLTVGKRLHWTKRIPTAKD